MTHAARQALWLGALLELAVAGEARARPASPLTLVPLGLRGDPMPSMPLEMLAGYGIWPPVERQEIRAKVGEAKQDGVSRMVVDTGLTELWRAYTAPAEHLAAVEQAAAAARGSQLATAFYLPSFELRKEKRDRGKGLLDCCRAWAQVTLDGRPYLKTRFGKDEFWNRSGDEALWVCPNSPWRQVFLKRAGEAVRRGAETLFVDVPYLQWSEKHATCRCSHCQARFKHETGLEIPTAIAPDSDAFRRWVWWRHKTIADFLGELRQAMRKVNPRARLVVEEFPLATAGATTARGLDVSLLASEVDVVAHEYDAKQFDKRPFSAQDRLDLAAALALYRGVDEGRPTWVLSYAHNVAGSRVSAGLHLAFDASFWETKGPEMNDTTVGRAWRRQLFGWFAQHRHVFGSSRPLATVVVLYSAAARDFSADHFTTLRQVQRALLAAHVPFRVLSTRDLSQLKPHHRVVLPAVVALGAREAKALSASGARLFAVGPPPSKDEWGLRAVDHRLQLRRVDLAGLLPALGETEVIVEGGPVVANLVQRAGEVQVRLASLRAKRVQATVSLRLAGVTEASQLALLGREQPLPLQRRDDRVSATVAVGDLVVLRLRAK
jgi:hypothetical protein